MKAKPITCDICKESKPTSNFSWNNITCKSCAAKKRKANQESQATLDAQVKKICYKCKESKDKSEFMKMKDRKSGLSSYCKKCSTERWGQYIHNPENQKQENTCTICQQTKHISEFSLSGRGYPEYRCKECMAKRAMAKTSKLEVKFTQMKGVAKRRGIPFCLTLEEYITIRSSPCHYCGHPLPKTGGLDRINSELPYTMANSVPCCTECNIMKGSILTHDEMLLVGEVMRKIKNGWPKERFDNSNGWGRPKKYTYTTADLHTPPPPESTP